MHGIRGCVIRNSVLRSPYPADTIVYLTQKMPVYGRRLKNTAGWERNVNFFTQYQKKGYKSNLAVSNVFQKAGSSLEHMEFLTCHVWKTTVTAGTSIFLIVR